MFFYIYAAEALRQIHDIEPVFTDVNKTIFNPTVAVEKFLLWGSNELSFGEKDDKARISRHDLETSRYEEGELHDNEIRRAETFYSNKTCHLIQKQPVCRGTDQNDVFHLENLVKDGIVFGQRDKNFLHLSTFGDKRVDLNISKTLVQSQKVLHASHDLTTNVTLDHIQHFIGRKNKIDNIDVDCYVETVDLQGGIDETNMDTVLVESINKKSCSHEDFYLNIRLHKFTKVTNRLDGRKTICHVVPVFYGYVSIDIQTTDALQIVSLGWTADSTRLIGKRRGVYETVLFVFTKYDSSFFVAITINERSRNVKLQFLDHYFTFLGDKRLILRKNGANVTATTTLQELIETANTIEAVCVIIDTRRALTVIALGSGFENTITRVFAATGGRK